MDCVMTFDGDLMPLYIVTLVSERGVIQAVGIRTAEQIWMQCESMHRLAILYAMRCDPVLITPVRVPHPDSPWFEDRVPDFDWELPNFPVS